MKGFLVKFSGPLGAGKKLLVVLTVVVVDTIVGVVLTADIEVGLSLLTTRVEVGLSLLTTGVEVGLSLLTTGVEVGLSLLTTGVEVGLSPLSTCVRGEPLLVTAGDGVLGFLVPPTIVGGTMTWLLLSVFTCLMDIRTYFIACHGVLLYLERYVLYVLM